MQDFKGTIANITKSVTKTSGNLLKTTKLSMNLSSEENNLKNLYSEIGKKVHEIYQYGGSLGKFFDEKYLEIEASERKIADIKEQIGVIKGTKACTKCGKTLNRDAEFCQKCGIRVELVNAHTHEPEPIPPHTTENATPPPTFIEPATSIEISVRNCRVCNTKNESNTKFCLSCGRILD